MKVFNCAILMGEGVGTIDFLKTSKSKAGRCIIAARETASCAIGVLQTQNYQSGWKTISYLAFPLCTACTTQLCKLPLPPPCLPLSGKLQSGLYWC